jgi:hypothetical protein
LIWLGIKYYTTTVSILEFCLWLIGAWWNKLPRQVNENIRVYILESVHFSYDVDVCCPPVPRLLGPSSLTMTIFMEMVSPWKNLECVLFRFYWARQVGFVSSTPIIKRLTLCPLHSNRNPSETKGLFVQDSWEKEAWCQVECF